MQLDLSEAQADDAPRIAEIHMAAFGSNAMLRAQFPTPAVRRDLQRSIEWKALADINDTKTTVLVVRIAMDHDVLMENVEPTVVANRKLGLEQRSKVIAFAKWVAPSAEGEDYEEPAWIWPEGTNLAVLNTWNDLVESVQARVLGSTPCYRLNFIGTDPLYERRGAASLMVRWGIEQCKKHNVPACLESTIEAAPLYENNHFVGMETFSLDLHGEAGENKPDVYREICFLYRPV